jgi:hypothetical protein
MWRPNLPAYTHTIGDIEIHFDEKVEEGQDQTDAETRMEGVWSGSARIDGSAGVHIVASLYYDEHVQTPKIW